MSPDETEHLILGAAGARVLLIGSGGHLPGSGLDDVPAVPTTINDLGRCLVERAGLDPGHLTTLIDPDTPQEIGDALMAVAAEATEVLLVHYVGHGLISDRNELHLATRRARLGLDRGLPEHQALPYTALRQALMESTAPLIVVVLDCCFAGRAQQVISIAAEDTPAGMYLLTSTDAQQHAWAPPGDRYTAFTGALIELLARGDPVAPRLLTLDDVYRSLRRTLTERGFPRPRRHAVDGTDRQPLAPNPAHGPGSSETRVGEFSPYRGLAAFGPDDARFFFGRDQLTATLLDRVAEQLERTGALMVVGPSGAGKTSLLHAGLIPALRRASTQVVSLVPGQDPVGTLASRLAKLSGADAALIARHLADDPGRVREVLGTPAKRPVIIVDQFERVFDWSQEEQRTFVRALYALCSEPVAEAPAVVVIGMRADFFGHAAAHPELLPGLQQPVVVGPMTAKQLRSAIQGPADLAGLDVQKGLTETILDDLGVSAQESAAAAGGLLPLLSHALLTTWHNLEGRTMTLAGYQGTGGIAQSLAHTADATLDRLDLPGRTMAGRLLPRLVDLGEDVRDTARSIPLADLLPPASSLEHAVAREVLEQFTRARLLTVDASSVQITHEALIRSWPRLRSWIEADRATLLVHQQLGRDARTWQAQGHDPAYVYRGNRLADAQRARARWDSDPSRYPSLSELAAEFLDASGAGAARAERRARRTRLTLALSLTLALIASLTGAGIAANAAARAEEQRLIALSGRLAALSGSLATADPRMSRLLAATALDVADTAEARQSVLNALANRARALLAGHYGLVRTVAMGVVDGRPVAVSGGEDRTVRVWDLRTGKPLGRPMTGHTQAVGAVAVSEADGVPVVVSGGEDGTVRIWDLRSGEPRGAPLTGHEGAVGTLATGLVDGVPVVVSGGRDGTLQAWSLRDGAPLGTALSTYSGFVGAVAVTSLGGVPLAVAGTDTGQIQVWNLRTGEETGTRLIGHDDSIGALAVGQLDGAPIVVSGDNKGLIRLWNLKTRKQIGTPLIGHQGHVGGLAVGQVDGRTIAVSGGEDGTVRVWDLATRTQVRADPLTGHAGPIGGVALGEVDGSPVVVSAGDDATLRVWDLRDTSQSGPPLPGHQGIVEATAAWQVDGVPVAISAGDDKTVRVWDLRSRKQLGAPMTGHDGIVYALAAGDLDGRPVAVSGGEDGTVRVWDLRAHRQLGTSPEEQLAPVGAVAMTDVDGLPVAVSGDDEGHVRLWDLRAMRPLGEPMEGHEDFVGALDTVLLDGLPVAVSGGKDGTVRMWDLRARKQLGPALTGHQGEIKSLAVTRLGGVTAAVTVGLDGTVRIWDLKARKPLGAPMTGHNGVVYAVATGHANGVPIAVTAGQDGTVRVWDLQAGKQIGAPLIGHLGPVYAMAMRRDMTVAITGERDDGALRVWDLATPLDLKRAICAKAQGPLTPEEWQTYLPGGEPFRRICA